MDNPDKVGILCPMRKKSKRSSSISCQECGKIYAGRDSYKTHIKQKHSDKSEGLLACLNKKYVCEQCGDQFQYGDLTKHKQSHKISSHKTHEMKCPLCDYIGNSRDILINHYRETHNLEIQNQTYQFESLEDFQLWKSKMEADTFSHFAHRRSNKVNNETVRVEYSCHRSGYFKTRGANIRHIKAQGSNKINGYCPANLKTIITDGKYIVHYCGSHVGHKQEDLDHLFLTKTERYNIAVKIAGGVPLQTILNEIRDSVSNYPLERLHLLTKKDLYNIGRSYNLNGSSVRHQNDAISVEDSELRASAVEDSELRASAVEDSELRASAVEDSELRASALVSERKQKLLGQLQQLVESVNSLEEIEVIERNIAPNIPSLEAVRNNNI